MQLECKILKNKYFFESIEKKASKKKLFSIQSIFLSLKKMFIMQCRNSIKVEEETEKKKEKKFGSYSKT